MVARLAGIPPRLVRAGLGWAGGIAILVAFAWWAALFPGIVANTGLTFNEAVPCVASNSQLCELATALCGTGHLFGINHYSPTLFWSGAALLCTSLLLGGMPPRTRR